MPSTQSLQRREQRRKLPKSILDRNDAVIQNLGLAHYAAIHHVNQYPGEQDDLIQEACLGLINGVANFDPKRGFRLSTYALARVHGQILHFRRDRQHTLRIPWRLKDLHSRGKRLQAQRLQTMLEPLDEKGLSESLNISLQRWRDAVVAHAVGKVSSLDVVLGTHASSGEQSGTLLDQIEDSSSVQDQVDEKAFDWLQDALSDLDPKQSDWLRARYIDNVPIKDLALRENLNPRLLRKAIRVSLSQLRQVAAQTEITQ